MSDIFHMTEHDIEKRILDFQEKLGIVDENNDFRVFNGEQISGLPELTLPQISKDRTYQMETQFINSSKCAIYYENINSAYYSPVEDAIYHY